MPPAGSDWPALPPGGARLCARACLPSSFPFAPCHFARLVVRRGPHGRRGDREGGPSRRQAFPSPALGPQRPGPRAVCPPSCLTRQQLCQAGPEGRGAGLCLLNPRVCSLLSPAPVPLAGRPGAAALGVRAPGRVLGRAGRRRSVFWAGVFAATDPPRRVSG